MSSLVKGSLIVAAVLFVGFGFTAVCSYLIGGGVGKTSGAEYTLQKAVYAYETRDADKVLVYFTPVPAGSMKNTLVRLFSGCDKIEVQNYKAMTTYEEGLAAHVDASWDLVLWVHNSPAVEHFAKTVKLIKIEDQWYINMVIP